MRSRKQSPDFRFPISDFRSEIARDGERRGMALVVVLVVIVLISLGAYGFCEIMLAETEAVEMFGRDAQARAFAESGVELAAALLGSPDEMTAENLYHNPEAFAGVLLADALSDRGRGRLSIVAPVENDDSYTQYRFGLIDESGKLNLNTIGSLKLEDEEQERNLLMSIPNMTQVAADGILDWIDGDSDARQYGAELETYEALVPPYAPADGELESLDELLLVNGVTPALLYGEDANRNGLLDPNENDGDRQLPLDNEDGVLDLGWSAYLTVYSREANLRSDGTERIHVNQALLTELYDELLDEFDEDTAKFITAYRLNGASNVDEIEGQSSGQKSSGDKKADEVLQGAAKQLARAATGGGQAGTKVTRGGLDLSKGAKVTIASLYELIDAEVEAEVDGKQETLKSPWTSDNLTEGLPVLLDTLSVSTGSLDGRININQARKELLLGLPDMTTDLVDGIAAARPIASDGTPLTEQIALRATTGWLLIEGLTDLTTMRKLDRYITARGDVFRVQVVGHFDAGGPAVRLEAVIDATEKPPKIVFARDLSPLGPGYRLQGLFQAAGM